MSIQSFINSADYTQTPEYKLPIKMIGYDTPEKVKSYVSKQCNHLKALNLRGIFGLTNENIKDYLSECTQLNAITIEGDEIDTNIVNIFKVVGTNLKEVNFKNCNKFIDAGGLNKIKNEIPGLDVFYSNIVPCFLKFDASLTPIANPNLS